MFVCSGKEENQGKKHKLEFGPTASRRGPSLPFLSSVVVLSTGGLVGLDRADNVLGNFCSFTVQLGGGWWRVSWITGSKLAGNTWSAETDRVPSKRQWRVKKRKKEGGLV